MVMVLENSEMFREQEESRKSQAKIMMRFLESLDATLTEFSLESLDATRKIRSLPVG
jgi:hypothetical protein